MMDDTKGVITCHRLLAFSHPVCFNSVQYSSDVISSSWSHVKIISSSRQFSSHVKLSPDVYVITFISFIVLPWWPMVCYIIHYM